MGISLDVEEEVALYPELQKLLLHEQKLSIGTLLQLAEEGTETGFLQLEAALHAAHGAQCGEPPPGVSVHTWRSIQWTFLEGSGPFICLEYGLRPMDGEVEEGVARAILRARRLLRTKPLQTSVKQRPDRLSDVLRAAVSQYAERHAASEACMQQGKLCEQPATPSCYAFLGHILCLLLEKQPWLLTAEPPVLAPVVSLACHPHIMHAFNHGLHMQDNDVSRYSTVSALLCSDLKLLSLVTTILATGEDTSSIRHSAALLANFATYAPDELAHALCKDLNTWTHLCVAALRFTARFLANSASGHPFVANMEEHVASAILRDVLRSMDKALACKVPGVCATQHLEEQAAATRQELLAMLPLEQMGGWLHLMLHALLSEGTCACLPGSGEQPASSPILDAFQWLPMFWDWANSQPAPIAPQSVPLANGSAVRRTAHLLAPVLHIVEALCTSGLPSARAYVCQSDAIPGAVLAMQLHPTSDPVHVAATQVLLGVLRTNSAPLMYGLLREKRLLQLLASLPADVPGRPTLRPTYLGAIGQVVAHIEAVLPHALPIPPRAVSTPGFQLQHTEQCTSTPRNADSWDSAFVLQKAPSAPATPSPKLEQTACASLGKQAEEAQYLVAEPAPEPLPVPGVHLTSPVQPQPQPLQLGRPGGPLRLRVVRSGLDTQGAVVWRATQEHAQAWQALKDMTAAYRAQAANSRELWSVGPPGAPYEPPSMHQDLSTLDACAEDAADGPHDLSSVAMGLQATDAEVQPPATAEERQQIYAACQRLLQQHQQRQAGGMVTDGGGEHLQPQMCGRLTEGGDQQPAEADTYHPPWQLSARLPAQAEGKLCLSKQWPDDGEGQELEWYAYMLGQEGPDTTAEEEDGEGVAAADGDALYITTVPDDVYGAMVSQGAAAELAPAPATQALPDAQLQLGDHLCLHVSPARDEASGEHEQQEHSNELEAAGGDDLACSSGDQAGVAADSGGGLEQEYGGFMEVQEGSLQLPKDLQVVVMDGMELGACKAPDAVLLCEATGAGKRDDGPQSAAAAGPWDSPPPTATGAAGDRPTAVAAAAAAAAADTWMAFDEACMHIAEAVSLEAQVHEVGTATALDMDAWQVVVCSDEEEDTAMGDAVTVTSLDVNASCAATCPVEAPRACAGVGPGPECVMVHVLDHHAPTGTQQQADDDVAAACPDSPHTVGLGSPGHAAGACAVTLAKNGGVPRVIGPIGKHELVLAAGCQLERADASTEHDDQMPWVGEQGEARLQDVMALEAKVSAA